MNLAVGQTLSAPAQMVRPEMMHVWAKVLRDPNPIHTDAEAVRARGWGDRVINQGPSNVAYVMNLLMSEAPQARLAEIKVRFLDNVFGGEMARPAATVRSIEETAQGRRITFDITLQADGRLVLDRKSVV